MMQRASRLIPLRTCARGQVSAIRPSVNLPKQTCVAYNNAAWAGKKIESDHSRPFYLRPKKRHVDEINEAEPVERYVPGGYHPVVINDILDDRYRVVGKLGHSSDATVWLAEDKTGGYVAVKVCTAEESSSRELPLMRSLSSTAPHPGQGLVQSLLHEFKIEGPHGTHDCYTMAPTRYNLEDLVKREGPIPRRIARASAAGMALAVAFLHEQKHVHYDLQLRNVSMQFPPWFDDIPLDGLVVRFGLPRTLKVEEPHPPGAPSHLFYPIYLANLGHFFPSLWETRIVLGGLDKSFSMKYAHRPLLKDCDAPMRMRPPETYFAPESKAFKRTDTWMLALSIWELVVGKPLFASHAGEQMTVEELKHRQRLILGPPPVLGDDGNLLNLEDPTDEQASKTRSALGIAYREGRPADDKFARSDMEEGDFLRIMLHMLRYNPYRRPPMEKVLNSRWMTKWAMPLLKKSQMGRAKRKKLIIDMSVLD